MIYIILLIIFILILMILKEFWLPILIVGIIIGLVIFISKCRSFTKEENNPDYVPPEPEEGFKGFNVSSANKSSYASADEPIKPYSKQHTSSYQAVNESRISINYLNFAGDTLFKLSRRYIAIDFETTGLSPDYDRIIEIGAVLFINGEPNETFSTLVNPGMKIPEAATRVNHITDEMVSDAPSESLAISRFAEFLGDALQGTTILCAHNANFDMRFLRKTLARHEYSSTLNVIDTLAVSKRMVPDVENHKLPTLIRHFKIQSGTAHRANEDAFACGKLLSIFLNEKQDIIFEFERKNETLELLRASYIEKRKLIEISPKNSRISVELLPEIRIGSAEYNRGLLLFKEGEEIRKNKIDDFKVIELFDKARETGFCSVNLYESYSKVYRKLKDFDNEVDILDEGISRLSAEDCSKLENRRFKAVSAILDSINKDNSRKETQQKKLLKRETDDNLLEAEKQNEKAKTRKVIQMTDDFQIVNTYSSVAEAARAVGVDSKGIRSAAKGIQKRSGGFLWKIEED